MVITWPGYHDSDQLGVASPCCAESSRGVSECLSMES